MPYAVAQLGGEPRASYLISQQVRIADTARNIRAYAHAIASLKTAPVDGIRTYVFHQAGDLMVVNPWGIPVPVEGVVEVDVGSEETVRLDSYQKLPLPKLGKDRIPRTAYRRPRSGPTLSPLSPSKPLTRIGRPGLRGTAMDRSDPLAPYAP